MSQYQAKLVSVRPASTGYVYPTYEYTNNDGQVVQVEGQKAVILNPWDNTKVHTIRINADGSLNQNNSRNGIIVLFTGILLVLIYVAGTVKSALGFLLLGIFLMTIALLPVIFSIKSCCKTRKRRASARHIQPISGKIVWYKEVVKHSKNHSKIRHYPIVEYCYQGQMFHAVLPDHEEPMHEGEAREFYLDIEHEDIFTSKSCKSTSIFQGIIFLLFFTIPFFVAGIGVIAPNVVEQWQNLIPHNWEPGNVLNLESFSQYFPLVCIGMMLSGMIVPVFIQCKTLFDIKNAKQHGQSVYATYIKTNDYGRRHVRLYEYTYNGQKCTYQSTDAKKGNVELYIHPKTEKAYSQRDTMLCGVKIGIMLFMILMVLLMAGPLYREWMI